MSNLVTVVTISKCKTANQLRSCQSQWTASTGNKPHSRTAGTLSSSRRHYMLLLSISTQMHQNVPRSPPSKFLPTHNLWPSFIPSDTAAPSIIVPSDKLIVAQTFKKLPTLYGNQSSITVHARLHRYVLSEIIHVYSLEPNFFNIHINIILPSNLSSSKIFLYIQAFLLKFHI
jgi:hypothetical protein